MVALSVRCTAYTLLWTIVYGYTFKHDDLQTHTGRTRLSRLLVLQAAVALADEDGLEGLTMRRLARQLGVVPMALYKHVANKDELLDGMVDIVFGEIESPSIDDDWRSAMRRRAIAARQALKRHSWRSG